MKMDATGLGSEYTAGGTNSNFTVGHLLIFLSILGIEMAQNETSM